MPIVDGLTSTKMIRSFEKSHPSTLLSTRASLNGRVPIIAVSASLLEKERQTYIDAGFDGWILKPIAFNRLSEIMRGIVDAGVRRENLYEAVKETGKGWEGGGWFEEAQRDVFAADTLPAGEVPSGFEGEGVRGVKDEGDPGVKEEEGSVQSVEQKRLLEAQEEERKSWSLPILESQRTRTEEEGDQGDGDGGEKVAEDGEEVASPAAME